MRADRNDYRELEYKKTRPATNHILPPHTNFRDTIPLFSNYFDRNEKSFAKSAVAILFTK